MRTRSLCAGMIVAALCVPVMSMAEEAVALPPGESAPPAVSTAPTSGGVPESRMRAGLNLVPSPFGSYSFGSGSTSMSGDLAVGFGIRPFFDYFFNPNVFLGFGPTYTLNVKDKNFDGSASKQLDLLVRVGGTAPVSDTIHLYGYLSPGYSWLMPPQGDSAKGFVLGINAGATYTLSPTVFVNGELGYQLGFQKVSVGSTSIDSNDKFMQIALGGGIRL